MNTGIQRVVRCIVNESIGQSDHRDIQLVGWINEEFHTLNGPIPKSFPAGNQIDDCSVICTATNLFKRILKKAFNSVRRLFASIIPYPPFVEFLLASSSRPGLTRSIFYLRTLIKGKDVPIPHYYGPTVKPGASSVLILLDSSWNLDIWPAVRKWKRKGAIVVSIIYDLIPITHGEYFEDNLRDRYRDWIDMSGKHSDAFICISKNTQEELKKVLISIKGTNEAPPPVSYFWLGSELDNFGNGDNNEPRIDITRLFERKTPLYLYVGTLEPRKNHAYILDALDILWEECSEIRFVIVGRIGWFCDDLVRRILGHAEFGRKLFMFNDANDSELEYLYNRVNGLLFSSLVEGFGLPIVEALQHGVPVFASDIPVFREIGEKGVTFFDLGNPKSLVYALKVHQESGAKRLDNPVRWLTWEESTLQFWRAIDDCLSEIKIAT